MKNKRFFVLILSFAVGAALLTQGALVVFSAQNKALQSETVAVQNVGSDILAAGTIHSQNEATLHFQTGGKLAYLPVKEGDNVSIGQTIAQLDTYALQQQLTAALNTYKSTRDTFDQTQANAQTGVLQNSQKSALNPLNQTAIGSGDTENSAINDAVQRIIDQNQANLDNSVISVALANYAIQMATLTSPLTGIITHEDVSVAGQNITPVTSFSVADPTQLVFRASVAASDIDFVSLGAKATVNISGRQQPITGTVIKIYPQKETLANGQDVYAVDIQSTALQSATKLGQTGSVLIASNAKETSVTVPTWTILGHNSIWVEENGKAVLKSITIGNVHGDKTEITSGLTNQDRIIISPKTIAGEKYSLL